MKVIVTGGHGKLGVAVVEHLCAIGHETFVFDRRPIRDSFTTAVDLTDYGQVIDGIFGIGGVEAIVHLAAIPAPDIMPDAETFRNNVLATYNVLQACRRVGIRRIVTASSETVLGLPFEIPPPYLPVDEEYPARPESTYSLVKHLEEQLCIQLCRWDSTLTITALRVSNVMAPEDYAMFPSFQDNVTTRRWNLWGYIDRRDAAQAVAKALEYATPGFETFVIANQDTVMQRPSAELAEAVFPGVPLKHPLVGRESLLSIAKAQRLLGYDPQYHWQRELAQSSALPGNP